MPQVTAALVIATREDGSHVYVYEGHELPDGLARDEVKRLQDAGLVSKDKEPAKAPASKPTEK